MGHSLYLFFPVFYDTTSHILLIFVDLESFLENWCLLESLCRDMSAFFFKIRLDFMWVQRKTREIKSCYQQSISQWQALNLSFLKGRDTERDLPSTGPLPNGQKARAGQGQSHDLHPDLPHGCRASRTCAIFCVPKHVSREKDQKSSSRDLKPCPYGMLMLQVVA